MTATVTVKRSFDPLTKSWGFSARFYNFDGAWGFSRADAIGPLWKRLKARGYTTYSVSYER